MSLWGVGMSCNVWCSYCSIETVCQRWLIHCRNEKRGRIQEFVLGVTPAAQKAEIRGRRLTAGRVLEDQLEGLGERCRLLYHRKCILDVLSSQNTRLVLAVTKRPVFWFESVFVLCQSWILGAIALQCPWLRLWPQTVNDHETVCWVITIHVTWQSLTTLQSCTISVIDRK